MIMHMRWLPTLIISLMFTLIQASVSFGQEEAEAILQKPGAPPSSTPTFSYILAFLVLIFVGFATLKSSKRSHQD